MIKEKEKTFRVAVLKLSVALFLFFNMPRISRQTTAAKEEVGVIWPSLIVPTRVMLSVHLDGNSAAHLLANCVLVVA
jgi:uncharacterized Zn finger protein